MFAFDQPLVVAGLLLGLSSSLHCFGMCTGIAASLHFATGPDRATRDLLLTTMLINAGRIGSYILAGALVGGLGSGIFGAFDHALANTILRWAAAAALGWIGLSMLEMLPLPTGLYALASRISGLMGSLARAAHLPAPVALLLIGAVWGFLPCAMVYATLFYAMLSGSWANGAVVMAGFGLGTLPMLVASGLGLPLLRRRAVSLWLRNAVGVAILMVGIVTAGITPSTLAAWCRS